MTREELEPFLSAKRVDRQAFQNCLLESNQEREQVVRCRLSTSPTPEGLKALKPLRNLMTELGFYSVRERVEFKRPGHSPPVEATDRLTFLAREEVGDSTFSDSFILAFQDSLDVDFQSGYRGIGPEQVISDYLSRCPEPDGRHTWFSELAYDAKSNLIGLVMSLLQKRKNPRRGNGIGCIYTLGVVPDKRGQGYVNDLLARGVQMLERERTDCIRSTAAASNFPMTNAFERAHFLRIEHWWEYEIRLSDKT